MSDGGVVRQITGHGYAGRGFFCTKTCGYQWAVTRCLEDEKQNMRTKESRSEAQRGEEGG
jgi:hypothetical protein